MQTKLFRIAILVLCSALLVSGCSGRRKFPGDGKAVPIPIADENVRNVTIEITSERLEKLWQQPGQNKIRLVEVFEPQGRFPKYRIFDVRPGSVYEALGIQERDIVVSGSGYAIYNPLIFTTYLQLLTKQETGEIVVERGGALTRFQYRIL
jgi:type II secretory pathway component PulC